MNALEKIKAYKLEEIEAGKAERSFDDLRSLASGAPKPRGFADALFQASREGYGLIAEIKKASPSKGLIREDFDPAMLAEAYRAGGATCLSVLTDAPSFQGSEAALVAAREAVDLPILRKEFMFDVWQVAEARAMGADCILLIMAALEDAQAAELEACAFEYGMDVLIEVHNREELDRAVHLQSRLIGINNRDLTQFVTSIDVTKELARYVPPDRLVISESGISTSEQLAELSRFGARCFLVGESLMRHADVTAATRMLLDVPQHHEGM